MRQISEARRHRVLSLSTRLKAINDARRELLRQLEELDAEARSVSLERNILHNLDGPTSNIPDEVFAMIFEEGAHSPNHGPHFGTLLSHVSHCWRTVAITTPTLWTTLRFHNDAYNPLYPMALEERIRVFLSRARLYPLDIYLIDFKDCSPETIQLISEHVVHCRELRTREVGRDCLKKLLECFSSKPTPLLSSIDLSSDERIWLPRQLFPLGAPRLRTVQLHDLDVRNMCFNFPAFSSVTHLRLMEIYIGSSGYSSFRDSLMALSSLHHLEIQLFSSTVMPYYLPIVLPTIQFLCIETVCFRYLGPLISNLRAASLATLLLIVWEEEETEPDLGDESELCLPSLKHLILANNMTWTFTDFHIFAQRFPDVERLSLAIKSDQVSDLNSTLAAVLCATGYSDDDEDDGASSNIGLQWPKLQTLAILNFAEDFDADDLHCTVLKSQEAGHPIRKLMLPETLLSQADPEAMVELKKLVAIEDFHVDWPTPFERGESDD